MIGRQPEDDSGETPLNVGKDLDSLGKAGLAEKPDTEKKLWLITDKGRKYIENPPVPSGARSRTPSGEASGEPLGVPSGASVEEITVPSQSDLFRSIGEKFRGAPQGQFYRLLRLLLQSGGVVSQAIHVEEKRI